MRRALIGKINSGLHKILRVEQEGQEQPQVLNTQDMLGLQLPPTPQELAMQELAQETALYNERVREKLLQVQHILFILPRGIKRKMLDNAVANKIRELIADIRVEDIPAKMLEVLNDLELL